MNRDKLDFGNDKIGKLFRAMFFPTLIGMLFNSILNLCDGMFVGHGVGSDALAAINIVAPVFLVCTGVGLMFGIGASVICGIRMAENNNKAARIIATQAIIAGAVTFALIIAICLAFTRPVLYLLGCSPVLEGYATDYMLWLLPGLMFLYLECAGMMLIRQDGAPGFAMSIQVIAALLNIILDWLMVFPMGFGIKGAAIATSISCGVGGVMVLAYFFFKARVLRFYPLKLSAKSLMLSLRNVGYMIKLGFATFIAEMAMGIMMVTGNYMFMSLLGEDGVAAFSIGCYLFPILFSINNSVAQSAQPIISYNFGSHNFARVRAVLDTSLLTASICGSLITMMMWLGAPWLVRIFLSPDVAAYTIALKGLPLLGLCAIFFALNITFIGYYQSCEKAGRSILYMLLRGVIFIVPLFNIMPRIIGVDGLWLALPASESLTLLVIVAIYLLQRRARRQAATL